MQEHNMAIPSQAEALASGVCRDYTGATHKGEERVRAISKDLDKTVVLRLDGQPVLSSSIAPAYGGASLGHFVTLAA